MIIISITVLYYHWYTLFLSLSRLLLYRCGYYYFLSFNRRHYWLRDSETLCCQLDELGEYLSVGQLFIEDDLYHVSFVFYVALRPPRFLSEKNENCKITKKREKSCFEDCCCLQIIRLISIVETSLIPSACLYRTILYCDRICKINKSCEVDFFSIR